MKHYIGLDIGGTKIAGGILTPSGEMLAQHILPTPQDYVGLVDACYTIIQQIEQQVGVGHSIGVGVPGWINPSAGSVMVSNLPFMTGKPFHKDLSEKFGRSIRMENDANCAALAESVDGAGVGYESVVGLIMGTGTGSGYVCRGKIVGGANGLTGEIGHLPLPFREAEDGPLEPCACKQVGCVEKSICGPALARLYTFITGKRADGKTIAELARQKDPDTLRVLDRYFEIVAKAMVVILHTFDPDVIVVSGGLNSLPGLYDEVPRRWGKYCYLSSPRTKFIPAKHGPMAGIRGAAWLWKE